MDSMSIAQARVSSPTAAHSCMLLLFSISFYSYVLDASSRCGRPLVLYRNEVLGKAVILGHIPSTRLYLRVKQTVASEMRFFLPLRSLHSRPRPCFTLTDFPALCDRPEIRTVRYVMSQIKLTDRIWPGQAFPRGQPWTHILGLIIV